jgi:hypothetical protein
MTKKKSEIMSAGNHDSQKTATGIDYSKKISNVAVYGTFSGRKKANR